MKKALILTLALLLLLPLSLCSCSVNTVFYPDADSYTAGNAEIKEPVDTLFLDWSTGSVTVEYHDENTVLIEEENSEELSEKQRLRWVLDGTNLTVRFSSSGISLNFFTAKKNLRVTLPRETRLVSFRAEISSATLDAKELYADKVIVSSASGDVKVSCDEPEEAKFSTASGKVDLTASGRAEKVTIDTASGNINTTLGEVGTLEIDTASGSINATLGEVGTLEIDTSSGDAMINAEKVEKLSGDSASGAIRVEFGNTPKECEIDTASGDVRLVLPADAGFTAKVDTASGDFECGFAATKSGKTYTIGDGQGTITVDSSSGDIAILPMN